MKSTPPCHTGIMWLFDTRLVLIDFSILERVISSSKGDNLVHTLINSGLAIIGLSIIQLSIISIKPKQQIVRKQRKVN